MILKWNVDESKVTWQFMGKGGTLSLREGNRKSSGDKNSL